MIDETTLPAKKPCLKAKIKRFAPLIIIAIGILLFFATGLNKYISFDTLYQKHAELQDFVKAHFMVAALIFWLTYIIIVSFSLPGGAVMTITGGFLFGITIGALLALTSATIGATNIFLIARTALGDSFKKRTGPFIQKLEKGFKENALTYLFILRLIPIFPFWLINLAPAFLGVKLRTYIIATFFGTLPGSIVFASLGNGLGSLIEKGQSPDTSIIFAPEILLPLIGLAIMALLPIAYNRYKKRNQE